MADFDGVIDPIAEWADIPDLSVTAVARGGPSGAMNAQAVAIAKRLKYIQQRKVEVSAVALNAENYFIAGEVDDGDLLQRLSDAIPNGGSGAVTFKPGKEYKSAKKVTWTNKRVDFQGVNVTFTATASMDYLFYFEGENCALKNFSVNKAAGVTLTAGIFLKGLQFVIDNITSRDQKWTNFIHMREVKESKFLNMDVQIDVTGRTGNVFLMDYCVNNSIDNCFFGFGAALFKGTGVTHPVNGYSNEGFPMTNVHAVYFDRVVDAVRFTAFTVGAGCVLDFCGKGAIFITNGHTLTVDPGTWIAASPASPSGFIGVGTGPTFDNVKCLGATFVQNGTITAATAFSLPGTNTSASFNRAINGMSMGVITQPATPMSLLANSVDAPGTPLANESFQTGTWTPGLSFGGNGISTTGGTYANRAAKYTKTGNRIDVEFYIQLSNKGTATGVAAISGLPFVADSTSSLYVGAGGYLNGVSGAGPLSAFVTPGTGNITIGYAGATGFTQLTNANFTNATEVSMSFSYMI